MTFSPQPKPRKWTSQRYLDWIKKQPCAKCGADAEPHHAKGIGNLSGAGMKAPDFYAMPLCHICHMEMHLAPGLWPEQWEMIARTLGRAITEGVLK